MWIILTFESDSQQQKFEAVFDRYKNLMLHKSYEILRDYSLAEDAVSEAFIRIYKNINKIDDPHSNRTAAFVMTIVKNAALSMLKTERKYLIEELPESQADEFNLEGHILSKISEQRVYSLVEELGEELKSVFILKYAYSMQHKDIAGALNITENNVTVRLHRARKKLISMLEKEEISL